jgi:hypothetical protein
LNKDIEAAPWRTTLRYTAKVNATVPSSKGERERFCRLRMDYQSSLLNDDERKVLAGPRMRFRLKGSKADQETSDITAAHLVLRHLLGFTWG